jgi:uncharacterized sulfatase
MNKIFNRIKPCIIATLIFIVSIFLLKIIETSQTGSLNFSVIIRGFAFSLIVSCCYSVLIFPLFLLFSFIQKQLALIVISVIFSLLVLFEAGLTIYFLQTSSLIGSEIVVRPLSETIHTIKASMNIFLLLFLIIAVTGGFIGLSMYGSKKKYANALLIVCIVVIVSGSISIHAANFLVRKSEYSDSNVKNYITSKSWYCFQSIYDFCKWQKTENTNNFIIDEEKIDEFIQEFPERDIVDKYYPLERVNNLTSSLSPFFEKRNTPPNIVIIVAESLGREWSGQHGGEASYTLFLDSLAKTGLYWKNCLTTTPRSFGVVPAITGSLPYGTKGFQFGNMPIHNSLLSIVKKNSYQTNAFYSGLFYFDAIAEYLIAQDVNYMSEFYKDFENNKTDHNGTFWGYNDDIMFEKTIETLNTGKFLNPMLNLIITITAHNDVDPNNPYFKCAFEETDRIMSSVINKKESHIKYRNRIASIVFTDQCIRYFFEEYRKREDFDNTIFIISGDHASGMKMKNSLSMYHVPLVIWSPLIHTPKSFPAIVSHLDITPSIVALLHDNYALEVPDYIHWIGNNLDTSSTFRSEQKILFLKYARDIDDILYNDHLYSNGLVYKLDEELNMIQQSDSLSSFLANKLTLYKYINKYVYNTNHLTKTASRKNENFIPISTYMHSDEITLTVPQKGVWQQVYLMETTSIPKTKAGKTWEKLKVKLNAEVNFLNTNIIEETPSLRFTCKGNGMSSNNFYEDRIMKFIQDEEITIGEWYNLDITKVFKTADVTDVTIEIYSYFSHSPEGQKTILLRNIEVDIEGISQ